MIWHFKKNHLPINLITLLSNAPYFNVFEDLCKAMLSRGHKYPVWIELFRFRAPLQLLRMGKNTIEGNIVQIIFVMIKYMLKLISSPHSRANEKPTKNIYYVNNISLQCRVPILYLLFIILCSRHKQVFIDLILSLTLIYGFFYRFWGGKFFV